MSAFGSFLRSMITGKGTYAMRIRYKFKIIRLTFHCIFQALRAHSSGDTCRVAQIRARVDLNQPRVVVLADHKVSPEQLERVWTTIHVVLGGKQCTDDRPLHSRKDSLVPNVLLSDLSQVGLGSRGIRFSKISLFAVYSES